MNIQNNKTAKILIDHLPMLRAQAGVTQAELADIAGIARATYAAVESQKRKMTLSVFVNLSEYFLSNEKTCNIIKLLGLGNKELKPFLEMNSKKQVAAFGGNLSKKPNETKRKIGKALKELDK